MNNKRYRMYPNLVRVGARGMLLDLFENFERPCVGFVNERRPRFRIKNMNPGYYRVTLNRMKERGWVTESVKEGKKFLRLTKKGRVQALLCAFQEIKSPAVKAWDGKWRVGLFDIPEDGKHERDRIRWMLKKVGFQKLQKSVYIYPFEIPSGVLSYLRESGLDRFIRFMRVDKMDEEKELRRKFKLK